MARRRLAGLSGKDLVNALLRGGFRIVRISGSHHILQHPDVAGSRVIVPVHRAQDLPPGTIRSIVEQSGLTVDELLALL